VRIGVPPLGDRPDDIEALALHFARDAGLPGLPAAVVGHLKARAWPGNGRELRNVVQAYAALGTLPSSAVVDEDDLDRSLRRRIDVRRPYSEQKDALVDRFTRLYLDALLAHTAGNQTAAADLAGLGRTYLSRVLSKYGLARRSRRGTGDSGPPD
jgi:DNA-binding NtrC family response regulator